MNASESQIRFIHSLRAERGYPRATDEQIATLTGGRDGTASRMITALLAKPKVAGEAPAPAPRSDDKPQAVVGIYEYDGQLYAVRPSRSNPDRTLALLIEVAPSNRMNQDGAISKLSFNYDRAKGMVYRLKDEHRMSEARAEELSIQYGNCICCGHGLKVAESVKRGIGPVCSKKYFN